jgi:hypothetical protein
MKVRSDYDEIRQPIPTIKVIPEEFKSACTVMLHDYSAKIIQGVRVRTIIPMSSLSPRFAFRYGRDLTDF